MIVVEDVLGNVGTDEALAAARDRHEAAGTLERVELDERDRRRSRFRTETDAGTEVGLVLGETTPEPGDVLVASDDRFVVVDFEPVEALSVDLPGDLDPGAAVEIGHAVGNRHWDLATRDGRVLVATDGHAGRRRGSLESELPAGARVSVEEVPPTVFEGSGPPEHSHGEGTTPAGDLSVVPEEGDHHHGDDGGHDHVESGRDPDGAGNRRHDHGHDGGRGRPHDRAPDSDAEGET